MSYQTKTTPDEKLADGFYILEIKNGETTSCKMLDEGEAGMIAKYRVERFFSSQPKDRLP